MSNIRPTLDATPGDSSSLENYLEAILVLTQEGGPSVRLTDLSEKLSIRKPSAVAAVKRLCEAGYALHEPYGDIRLTHAGRERAKAIASRHVLLHRFLADVLGVEEETAQGDACRLEHDLSEKSMERLEAFLEIHKREDARPGSA
jgi:Mn-dependent DtxR family transcriptional regulator